MILPRLLKRLSIIALLSSLVSCGGGSGGGGVGGSGVAGIGGTGIKAAGTITGFGSIFVNGIEFETGSATISLDNNPATENQLRLGMVVVVNGSVDAGGTTGTATSVSFNNDVQGPISAISTGPDGLIKTLDILGVQVQVEKASTVIDGVTFDTLAVNDAVEVSGYVNSSGIVQATRLEKQGDFVDGTTEVELKGSVTGLNGTRFTLGSFSVDFSTADVSDLPGGTVSNGLQVEVRGTLSGTLISANRIRQEDELFDDDEDGVSLEGVINDFVDNSNFRIAGQSVDASNALLEPVDLVLENSIAVEVKGSIVNGTLQATLIEARSGDIKIDATVASVNTSAATITLQFVPGTITVSVKTETSMQDQLGIFNPYVLADISVGDFLQVRGFADADGNVIADEIRRDNVADDSLQGPVDNCTAGSDITLFGLSFGLNDDTEYEDDNDATFTDSSAFCDAVNSSDLFVKIGDDQSDRDGIADEAELED